MLWYAEKWAAKKEREGRRGTGFDLGSGISTWLLTQEGGSKGRSITHKERTEGSRVGGHRGREQSSGGREGRMPFWVFT